MTNIDAHPSARGSGLAQRHAQMPIARRHHFWRWLSAAVLLALLAWFGWRIANTPSIHWNIVADYLFRPNILTGVGNTVIVTVFAMAIGIAGGLLLAICRLSGNPVLRAVSGGFVWFFRGVPVLVQLIFWFNLGLVFKSVTISIPFTGVTLFSEPVNNLITPFSAVLLGLGLNEAAYMAEIIRSGIISVPRGQTEAAASLGMSPVETLRKIVLPQAARIVVPPTSNELITVLKISSLASVVTYRELLTTVQNIYSVNLATIELLIVASVWYVVLTTLCTFGQRWLERHFGRAELAHRSAGAQARFRIRLPRKSPS